MRRVVVLLSLCAGLAASARFGIIACGGDPKPPLTPDEVSHEDNAEAGPPGTPTPPPATK